MAQLFDISIFGQRALQRSLDALEKNLQRKYMRTALRAGSKVQADEVRRNAPVDTGRLKRGIMVRAMKRSRTRIGYFTLLPKRERLGISPFSKWYYPAVLEFGGVTKTGRVIPALGFMRRSLHLSRERALNVIGLTLWQQITSGLSTTRDAA